MMRPRWLARTAAFLLGTLWPAIGQACPFCFSGSPRVRMAFFETTILLSLLPLAMLAVGVIWMFRSGRMSFAEDFEDDDFSEPAAVEVPVTKRPSGTGATPAPLARGLTTE